MDATGFFPLRNICIGSIPFVCNAHAHSHPKHLLATIRNGRKDLKKYISFWKRRRPTKRKPLNWPVYRQTHTRTTEWLHFFFSSYWLTYSGQNDVDICMMIKIFFYQVELIVYCRVYACRLVKRLPTTGSKKVFTAQGSHWVYQMFCVDPQSKKKKREEDIILISCVGMDQSQPSG